MSLDKHIEKLEAVANLLEQAATPGAEKSASTEQLDVLTSLRAGIYMQSKKASYLDLMRDLSNQGVLK